MVAFGAHLHATVMKSCSHIVEFCISDEQLVEHAADFIQDGFVTGCACIVAITPAHRVAIDAALATRGLNTEQLIADYKYIVIDAGDVLRELRPGARFDVAAFHRKFGQLITLAAAGGKHVRIMGELVTLLAQQGEGDAVIELEELWNDLSRVHSFTLYCLYPDGVFESCLSPKYRQAIRALHSRALDQA
jgi:MEDS: MEthanogen/methylotroph, DcmR Sensory domain